MNFKDFLNECQEKGVFKSLSIYVVSSWVLLQVISLLAEPLNLPSSSLTVLLLILLVGFPVYAYFIWHYRIKPENAEKRQQAEKQFDNTLASPKSGVTVDPENDLRSIKRLHKRFQKMYISGVLILGVISLLATVFIIKTNFFKRNEMVVSPLLTAEKTSDKIAVLHFDNNTGSEQYDIVGKMAVDWIMHGITKNKIGQVISPKIIDDYSKVLKASLLPSKTNTTVTKYLKPSKVINGSFYLKADKLLFQSAITNENMSETLVAFGPIECNNDTPLDCIEELKQRILGFLVTEETPLENLQESPPKFEAYRYLMEAKNRYGNDRDYVELVEKAIAADSTFFEAKISKMEYYYNRGEYHLADSMVNVLSMETIGNDRQSNLLKMYGALLEGNNGNTYEYLRNEYGIYPFDLETNTSTMTVALQFVNRPEDVNAMFDVIPEGEFNLDDCPQCGFRFRIKGLSEIEMGNYQNALQLLKPFERSRGDLSLKEVIIRAKIREGVSDENINGLLSNFKLRAKTEDWQQLALFTGREYAFFEKDSLAKTYLDNVIKSATGSTSTLSDDQLRLLGHAHIYKKEYDKAQKYWEAYIERNPDGRRVEYLGLLAISYQQNGATDKARSILEQIEKRRKKYMFGHVDYALARYYATMGDSVKTYSYLMKAVADGKWFEPNSYKNDFFFRSYSNGQEFEKILNFWK